jgi:lysophospholipase L1-like esterase
MAELARVSGIRFVICSALPADHYKWRPDVRPAEPIRKLNEWLKTYTTNEKLIYVDYYSALVDENGGMREGTSLDGVHPTPAGYALMTPLVERGIAEALKRKP